MVAQLTAEGAYAPATKKQQEEIRDAYEAYYKQQIGPDWRISTRPSDYCWSYC